MDYTIVSADSHVDMSWLPGDLFVKNCKNPALLDQMPRIIETEKGLIWMAEGDNELGVAQSAGFEFIPPQKGRRSRTDKMIDAGFYDGPARPVDPELRLKDMTLDGVDCEILYGITGAGKNLKDLAVVTEVYRIYNDWVDQFGASIPGKWYGTACMPFHDPNIAADEIRRVKDHEYIRGADLMVGPLCRPLYARDGYWDPVWSACVDTKIPVSFHIGGSRIPIQEMENMETKIWASEYNQNELGFQAVRGSLGMYSMVQHMMALIFSGALDKYPDLRFVMAESGTGWVPFALTRMDHIFEDAMLQGKLQEPAMTMKPSEYWFRNGFTTFQEEESAGAMAHLVGIDNVMWGSDYPHPDSVWPDSLEKIEEALGNLDEGSRKKIVRDNAMELYNIGSARRK